MRVKHLDSDTKVACISGAPSEVPEDWFFTNKNLSSHPWQLDDEKLAYPAYEKFVKAAKDWPQLNFISSTTVRTATPVAGVPKTPGHSSSTPGTSTGSPTSLRFRPGTA
jgi:hypothetical protein